ncbi:MAG TPA: hypothetical protein VLT36_09955, partial [Candidatus Dormibacteraeota bacterium]|nr:hypothetical protein [Candidatus Dormibacteraeota bacterium]
MRKPPSLTPKLLALTLGLCSAIPALADFYPIPLTPGSFNKDIVVEKTASPPAQMLVTANLDAGTNLAGIAAGGGTGGNQNSMYEIGFGTTAGTGLPFHGTLFNAQSNTTHHFRMPADYTTNNAIFVGGSGTVVTQVVNGSFALNTPAAYTHLSVLATAGSGPTRLVYYVNYSDGSQDANFFDVPDYLAQTGASVTNNTAWVCNGDFRGLDGSFQQVNSAPQQIRLYFNDIPLSFPSSLVTNIQFVYYTGGRAAIFGLSGSTDNGATFNPIGVSGYNADMVIEAPLATAVTATVDNGLLLVTNPNRGDNNTWYEVGFDLLQPANTWTGIPVHGSTFTAWSNANYTFTMPPSYTANDALMVGRDGFTNGTLTLASPAIYTNLAVLHAGNGYMGSNFYTIHHADASVETGVMTNFDWFQASDTTGPSNPSNKVAYVTAGRVATGRINVINNGGSLTAAKLFWVDLPVNNTSSAVTSVDITYGGVQGNRTHIFALSGSDGTSVANTPIALSPSSYNVDVVVEASAVTNMDSRAYTSATMDGGTNNNANTWYEQGWNKLAPLSGLPPAGTIISSTNLADHHYVMPATYVGPNAVYCDSNNPTASITFASPTNVLALSFLSANANQEIQIRVVINHLTSPAETNVFTSWDWFRQTGYPIPAYTVNGRVSTDTKSLNNFLPGTSNPNLLEAQFALQNTTDPVTGASFTWTTNNGLGAGSSTSSRFVILAVSGTTNLVAPILTLNPLGTNVFEGSNVVLTAGISGGTPPITFEWRKGTN